MNTVLVWRLRPLLNTTIPPAACNRRASRACVAPLIPSCPPSLHPVSAPSHSAADALHTTLPFLARMHLTPHATPSTTPAYNRGINIICRSKPLKPSDLLTYDYIIGMDAKNERAVVTAAKHWATLPDSCRTVDIPEVRNINVICVSRTDGSVAILLLCLVQ